MTSRVILTVVVTSLAFLAAACGGDSAEPKRPLSVSEALTAESGVEIAVEGFILFDGDELRLCEALAESFPPQCGGAFLVVQGIDVAEVQGTTEAQGVVWTDSFTLLTGTSEDGVLVVAGATTTDAGIDLIARIEVAATAGSFGLESGDPIPGSLVELRSGSMTLDDPPLFEARTDESGEAVLQAPAPGTYMIFATAETEDPLCFWAAGPTEADVSTSSEVVIVEALLACE